MHEYKHGELKRGPGGKGGKVKNRRQAIAIALHEGGASKYESKSENQRDFARTKSKERHGETAQQEREGKSHVGASGRRESSRAMGGENATHTTSRGRKSWRSRKSTGGRKPSSAGRSTIRSKSSTSRSGSRKASGSRKRASSRKASGSRKRSGSPKTSQRKSGSKRGSRK
jgi:hypothetical protein